MPFRISSGMFSMRPCCCTSFNAFFGPMPLMPSLKSVPTRIAEIDKPFARDAPARRAAKSSCIVSGHDRAERPLARQELFAGNRQEAHEPGRAEEQRVVVFARGRPDVRRRRGHVCRLRFAFGRCLHGRHTHKAQQLARLCDHLSRQPRCHRGFRVGLGQVAARQRTRRAPLRIFCLTGRRFAISWDLSGGGAPSNTNTSLSACSAMSRVVR